jgi:hypothetical protein
MLSLSWAELRKSLDPDAPVGGLLAESSAIAAAQVKVNKL